MAQSKSGAVKGSGMVVVIRGKLWRRVMELALRTGTSPRKAVMAALNRSTPRKAQDLNAVLRGWLPYKTRRVNRWLAGN